MRTSRLAVFHSKDQPFTYETVAVPPLRAGEILVRNEYTTLCRSDLTTFTGKRIEKTPTILGHEIVGRIEELGPGAPTRDGRGAELRVGDRVTWAIYASDPCSCLARRGIPQKGEGLFKYGHEQIKPDSTLHGGLAEYCILRQHTPVIRVNQLIPLTVIALINCSVATVAGSLRLAGEIKDRNVVIAGAGMLGVVACAMSRNAGAARVIAVDIDDARLATAREFGADVAVKLSPAQPLKEQLAARMPGEAVTVALDFSGVSETMEALIGALGIGGTLVLVGAVFPQRPLQINAEQLVRNLHKITGLHNYNVQDLIAAVEFIEHHHTRFSFERLVHDKFDLDSVNEAFNYAVKSGAHRVGIRTCTDSGCEQ
jgi:putative phosphonate catabolism associated alcohol dehydrogenase